jgi:hypothetical protein
MVVEAASLPTDDPDRASPRGGAPQEEPAVSNVPTDPTGAGAAGSADQPSEEEVREYLTQLRGAPVEQVVAEVASALLNAAQVKLGRNDGRLLIDLTGALTEGARKALPEEVTKQLDDALSQLRLAQVEAEQQVAASSETEDNDVSRAAADQAAEGAAGQGQASGSPSSAASRLWTPGG